MSPKALLILISLACCISHAANDSQVRQSLDEVTLAKDQTDMAFREASTNSQKERLRYISQRLTSAENLLQSSLGGGSYPPAPPPPSNGSPVEIYHSDTCSGTMIGIANPGTRCEKFAGASEAWAVKINGECLNIPDTTATLACEAFKASSTPSAIKIFASDTCSGSPMAIVDYNTRCENLKGLHDAWGIMLNGRCENISDLPIEAACERYRP